MSAEPDIIYTKVDEAPELASASFLPIIQSFAKTAGVNVGTKDISLAGRIIALFPDKLKPEQRQPDDLALLGEIVMTPESNVIKLPNISASLPQIHTAVTEMAARRSELPCLNTGFTALPLTLSNLALVSFSSSVLGSSG